MAPAATPRVVPGWPVASAAGSVHDGTGGGPVVIDDIVSAPPSADSSVAAFRLDGTRRWLAAFDWACGNCNDGRFVPGRQPDGTYGPIGPEGSGAWAIDRSGRRVAACAGVVLADGTCIHHAVGTVPGSFVDDYPAVVSERRGTTSWEYAEPSLDWSFRVDFDVPPVTFRDATGGIYTSFGAGTHRPSGTPIAQQTIALDGATGALRWRFPGAFPVAALGSGVIVERAGVGFVALGPDGVERWTFPAPTPAQGWRVAVDATRNRVYVTARDRFEIPSIVALDLTTGREAWRTRTIDRASLLSIGPNGLVYAAIARIGSPALRAIGPDGKGRWQFPTASEVTGARRLVDGTVALTTREPDSFSGLLWRIDPRRFHTARPLRTRISLSRSAFSIGCGASGCAYRAGLGTVMRIETSRAGLVRIRLLASDGSVLVRRRIAAAPGGVSYVRLFAGSFGLPGRRIIEVRGHAGGHGLAARFPVTMRP